MKTFFALSTLALLLLFGASSLDARNGPGEYWKAVMKDQPMPESIQGLINPVDAAKNLNHKEEKPSVKDFKPRDNSIFYYHSYGKPTDEKYYFAKNIEPRVVFPFFYHSYGKPASEKSVVENFESKPDSSK